MGVAFGLLLGNGNGNIAAIFHLMSQRFQASLQTGHAHGGWTHIDAAARLPKVERHANYANLSRNDASGRIRCHIFVICNRVSCDLRIGRNKTRVPNYKIAITNFLRV